MNQGGNEEFLHLRWIVQLPNLQRLCLALPLSHCVNILENLAMPSSCKLNLMTHGFSSLSEEFYCLVDIIEQKFNVGGEDTPFGNTVGLSISPSTFVVQAFSEKDDLGPYLPGFYLSVIWETASDGAVPPYIDPFTVLRGNPMSLSLICVLTSTSLPNRRIGFESSLNFLAISISISHLAFHFTIPPQLFRGSVPTQPHGSRKRFGSLLPLMNSISFLDVNFASSLHLSNPNLLKKLLDFVTIRLSDLNVSPIACMTFQDCRSMSKNRINRLANVGVRWIHLQ